MKTLLLTMLVLGMFFAAIGYDTKAATPQSQPATTRRSGGGQRTDAGPWR